jgi:hypothetical protein
MYRDYLKNAMNTGFVLGPLLISVAALAQTPAPQAAPSTPAPTNNQWMPPAAASVPVPAQAQAPAELAPSGATDPAAAPAQPAPEPKMQLATQAPAPPPVITRTDKTHDGFYARLSFGFGSQSTTLDDGLPAPNFESTAGALVFNGLLGGAPAPGVIIGGSLALDSLPSSTFDADGYESKTGVNLLSLGPFIDGYPDSRGGFHLGGTVGPAFARLTSNTGFAGSKSAGLGLAAWLGYDWWVADQWSVGGLLRFSGANTWSGGSEPKLGADVRSIAILVTAVYQ